MLCRVLVGYLLKNIVDKYEIEVKEVFNRVEHNTSKRILVTKFLVIPANFFVLIYSRGTIYTTSYIQARQRK